jgi:hypothetical protein
MRRSKPFPRRSGRETSTAQFRDAGGCASPASTETPTPAAPPAIAPTAAGDEPDDEQEDDGADSGVDDQSNRAYAQMHAQSRQHPIANERADNADKQIADQAKSGAAHDFACRPPRDNADDQNDEKTFVGQIHASFPPTETPPRNAAKTNWLRPRPEFEVKLAERRAETGRTP